MESPYQVDVFDVDLINDLLLHIIIDPDQVLHLAQRRDRPNHQHEPLRLMINSYVLDILFLIIINQHRLEFKIAARYPDSLDRLDLLVV